MTNYTRSPQSHLLVVNEEGPAPAASRASQAHALVVFSDVNEADFTLTPQAHALALTESEGVPRTSQMYALAVYGEGVRENNRVRAWYYVLDGNGFYVLHLGMLGTWVYSINTGTWSQFITSGYANWNAEQGLNWNDYVLAGDSQNGTLWEVNPDGDLDEGFKPINRVVTAILPASARQRISLFGVWLTVSSGYPASPDTPLVGLRFSDDYGRTWVDMTDCAVTMDDGDFTQEVAFRSLGSFGAPGRIVEISDSGGMVRIDRAAAEDDSDAS